MLYIPLEKAKEFIRQAGPSSRLIRFKLNLEYINPGYIPFVEFWGRKAIVITYVESFVKIRLLHVGVNDADCHFQAEREVHWWRKLNALWMHFISATNLFLGRIWTHSPV